MSNLYINTGCKSPHKLDSNKGEDKSSNYEKHVNETAMLIQDAENPRNHNKLKNKIAAANIINLYGKTSLKNKKLQESLRNILERQNL